MHTNHRPDPRPNSEPNASPNEPNASKNPTAFSVWISNESENTNCLFGTQQHNTAPYQMRSHSLSHLSRYSLGKRSFGRKQFNNLTIIQFLPQSDTESHSDGGDDVRSQSEWESEKLLNGMKIPHQQILCQERFSRWERESQLSAPQAIGFHALFSALTLHSVYFFKASFGWCIMHKYTPTHSHPNRNQYRKEDEKWRNMLQQKKGKKKHSSRCNAQHSIQCTIKFDAFECMWPQFSPWYFFPLCSLAFIWCVWYTCSQRVRKIGELAMAQHSNE